MLSEHISDHLSDHVPQIDEGWWSSVLADEESVLESAKEHALPLSPSGMGNVDWERAKALFDQDEIIVLQVYGCNRGGVLVQGDGVQGFVPVSHLVDIPSNIDEDERRCRLAAYVGRSLNLKVIECESSLERIVLSERAALAGEGCRKQLFRTLSIGERVKGCVTNVTDFGVFVDLGGVEGLIHVSELSWGRVQHPGEVLLVGQQIETLVLQVCEENSRVALSLKRLHANPWDTLIEKYKPGDTLPAKVTAIMRFGAFARLEEGIEGLIHISSISMPPDKRNLDQVFQIGQSVKVQILHIDAPRRRLGLGLVAIE